MSSRIILAASVALGITGVVGLAYADNDSEDAAEDAREAAAQSAATTRIGDAIALAEKEIPGGRVIGSEIDTENGIVSYVIDVEKDGMQSVVIDVATGEVISVAAAEADDFEASNDDDDDDDEDEDEDEDGDEDD